MPLDPLLQMHRRAILDLAARHGARNVRVFGSMARGEAGTGSDVDLLVESGPRRTFFFPGGFIADLQELLGRDVDVVTEEALHPYLRDHVVQAAVPL